MFSSSTLNYIIAFLSVAAIVILILNCAYIFKIIAAKIFDQPV